MVERFLQFWKPVSYIFLFVRIVQNIVELALILIHKIYELPLSIQYSTGSFLAPDLTVLITKGIVPKQRLSPLRGGVVAPLRNLLHRPRHAHPVHVIPRPHRQPRQIQQRRIHVRPHGQKARGSPGGPLSPGRVHDERHPHASLVKPRLSMAVGRVGGGNPGGDGFDVFFSGGGVARQSAVVRGEDDGGVAVQTHVFQGLSKSS
mmetsp:Transcript_13831/g.30428  ORF Transcript_13831/g.30428 Transcript_13831/m.30428 type:complete len:204 (+) Transcript_13831:139-750(+)